MSYLRHGDHQDLRTILCIKFETGAPPGQVSALQSALMKAPDVIVAMESAGSFDFIVEIATADMQAFDDWRKRYWVPSTELVAHCATSFVFKRHSRRDRGEPALWVRTADGTKRIDAAQVDKIAAEGDYVQVIALGARWLLHSTLQNMRTSLGSASFVQLHRSVIVNRHFIERLSHQGRTWTAHLVDGSVERISRSHLAEVLALTHSSAQSPHSSTVVQFTGTEPSRSSNS